MNIIIMKIVILNYIEINTANSQKIQEKYLKFVIRSTLGWEYVAIAKFAIQTESLFAPVPSSAIFGRANITISLPVTRSQMYHIWRLCTRWFQKYLDIYSLEILGIKGGLKN